MSHQSGTETPLLNRGGLAERTFAPWQGPQIFQIPIFNERFVYEANCGVREPKSCRSLGPLSPFYRSRPASPISERDQASFTHPNLLLDGVKAASMGSHVMTPDTQISRTGAVPIAQARIPNPPVFLEKSCQTSSAGVQTLNLRLRHPKAGFSERKKRIRSRRNGKNGSEVPQSQATADVAPEPPLRIDSDLNLRNKIGKLRSYWGRGTRLLPNTFKISYLCPVQRQSEFLDFSLKEILLDENPQNGPGGRSDPAAHELSSEGKPDSTPWPDYEDSAMSIE